MMACRTASIVAFSALFGAGIVGACREPTEPTIPPLTTAHPTAELPLPTPGAKSVQPTSNLGDPDSGAPLSASFVEGVRKIPSIACVRVFVTTATGSTKVGSDTLGVGDVIIIANPLPTEINAGGLAVMVQQEIADCAALSKPPPTKTIVRAKEAPELKWANGTMRAHLDVGAKPKSDVSPTLYLGRLEGTAAVAEHDHPTSNEILIAIEAAGTFVLDGKETRLGPRQIVHVPRGKKHSWKPDPGSKLVAIQLYDPPGPEQRFIALAAATQDAGADAARTTGDAGNR